MSTQHEQKQRKDARTPQASQTRAPVDPASQSPDAPIEFARGDETARGNTERANAEPEPAALHDAQVPGKPDAAAIRRHAK
jgi:hypothetical protein